MDKTLKKKEDFTSGPTALKRRDLSKERKIILKVFLFLYNYIIIINLRVDSSLKGCHNGF